MCVCVRALVLHAQVTSAGHRQVVKAPLPVDVLVRLEGVGSGRRPGKRDAIHVGGGLPSVGGWTGLAWFAVDVIVAKDALLVP